MFRKDPKQVYRCVPWEQFGWLDHGFGTRASGRLIPSDRLTTLRQIHSGIALVADGQSGCVGEGDALVTAEPGRLLAIRTADCLPILIVDPIRRAVAAVHAGWRGTLAGIVLNATALLAERYGSTAGDLQVAIGPGVQKCCFEVGPEVAVQFQGVFPERNDLDGRTKLDLTEANRRLLERRGVPGSSICSGAPCTSCQAAEFYSYRREPGTEERMESLIGIRSSDLGHSQIRNG